MKPVKFRIKLICRFLTFRIINQWNYFPRATTEYTSLESFSIRENVGLLFFFQTDMLKFKEELIEAGTAVCTMQEIILNVTLDVLGIFYWA